MITDPVQIDQIIGPKPEQIAALEAATNWHDRLALLIPLLWRRPLALGEVCPWWLEPTGDQAMASWGARQDRSGFFRSPVHQVPAGKAQVQVSLDLDGDIPDNGQDIELRLFARYDDGGPFEPAGSTVLKNGDNLGNGGVVIGYSGTFTIEPDRYPLQHRIEAIVAGVLNVGFNVDYIDPPAP